MNWKSFIIGTIVGLLLGFGAFAAIGNRYYIIHGTLTRRYDVPKYGFVRIDTWTGKTWLLRGSDTRWTELN